MDKSPYHPECVGKRITKLRESEGMTPTEFAKAAELPRSSLANWEAGRQRPGFKDAGSICRRFGVTSDWLFFGMTETLRHEVFVRLFPQGEAE